MSNQLTRGLLALIMLSPWSSAGYADAKSDQQEKTETEKAEPASTQAPPSIVFVPHDFGAPEVTEAGGVRGASQMTIQLLAPPKLSKAMSPTPTFYWHAGQALGEHRFTLTAEDAIEPLLEVSMEPTHGSGINSLSLAAHSVQLNDPGLYRWSIAANLDQDPIAAETVAQTLFVFDGDLKEPDTDAPPAERAAFLAENGYWYDLFHLISRQSDLSETDRQGWLALRTDLLDQVGLVLPLK